MLEVQLSCGRVEYASAGDRGPVVVLLHGLAMNHLLWRDVIANLSVDHRCYAPTLPEGAHRFPVRRDYDLTISGVPALIGEFLEALNLNDVVLVENDSGRAQTFAATRPTRLGKLMIVACEAFENFPPGFAGKMVGFVARIPGGIWLMSKLVRSRNFRRSALVFGSMSNRPVPDAILDSWLEPLMTSAEIRSDFGRYCRSVRRHEMLDAANGLRAFDKPVCIVWAADDRLMPAEHGQRFVNLLPNAHLEVIQDSGTLVPLDQPLALAASIRRFAAADAYAPEVGHPENYPRVLDAQLSSRQGR